MNLSKSTYPRLISKEVKKQIMATDIYVGVISDDKKYDRDIANDIDVCIFMFRQFEKRFSRFIRNNELSKLNTLEIMDNVSYELFEMLELSQTFNKRTNGFFDPTVLPILHNEGYSKSFLVGFDAKPEIIDDYSLGIGNITIEKQNMKITKPKKIKIDLGGIGKSYVVRLVSDYLAQKYSDFVVDAGGDIYYAGNDRVNGYSHWLCSIKHSPKILKLKNNAVATSSTQKRKWFIGDEEKNHIIDINTQKSVKSDCISATVVSCDIIEADIIAKYVLSLGIQRGILWSNSENVATLLIGDNFKEYESKLLKKYIH